MTDNLPKIWWLWVPVAFMALQITFELFLPHEIRAAFHSESGPHEMLQFLVMLAALVLAVRLLPKINMKTRPWLGAWTGMAAMCCLYVAGEEISWGQHALEWSTPEFWKSVNDQGETNLHNTSSWLDQKPRLILLIGVITGGLVFPALQRYRPGLLPAKFAIIYPPACLGVTAAFALGINLADKIDEALRDITLFERASEVEELYLFYFVLLYLVVLGRRVAQEQG